MIKLITVLFLLSVTMTYMYGQSNEGTKFWFGFMEHVDDGNNSMVAMITSKKATSGTLSAPGLKISKSFSTTPGIATLIQLPSTVENIGSEAISNKGIVVESSGPISLYIHQYAEFRSEASLILPFSSIGTDYYVMSYNGYQSNNQRENYSEFLIIATTDSTIVEITPSARTQKGKAKDQSFSIQLMEGQTYQVQASQVSEDFTGSFISANKDIAVLGGTEWSQVPVGCTFMDNLVEQMYPITTWGKKYITAPSINVQSDIYRILASENNTNITVQPTQSGTQNYNLDRGEFVEYQISADATEIQSDKPILVAHFNVGSSCSGNSIGDPSMLLINSIEQSRDTVTLYNSPFQNITENYISAIIKTEDTEITTFDGSPIADVAIQSQAIGSSGIFSYFVMAVSPGSHTIISPACGVIASAYGYGAAESYSYGGGANFKDVNSNPLPDGGCLNDTIIFDSGLSPFRFDVEWDFGDGTEGTEVVEEHFYDELGSYDVVLKFYDKCLDVSGELMKEVFVTLRDKVDALDDVVVCENLELALSASDLENASYLWSGPNGFSSTDQFPQIDTSSLENDGIYEVIGIISGCATFPAETQVTILPAPIPVLERDSVFCSREGIIELYPGNFNTYLWNTGSSQSFLEVYSTGNYSITVTDENDCPGATEIGLVDLCPAEIFVPNIFSPNDDGVNDLFEIQSYEIQTFKIIIVDRWGNKVFETTDLYNSWDGTSNGVSSVPGVYAYFIAYSGFNQRNVVEDYRISGTITVVK